MAWIESHTTLLNEPILKIGFIPKTEREFQDWLYHYKNWESIFNFNLYVREYLFSKNCKVDYVGFDDEWINGYLIELKLGKIKSSHKKQVDRYLNNILLSKSWTIKVVWHGYLLNCIDDNIYFYYVGERRCHI